MCALIPITKYPGKVASDPTNYPYGKAQNITVPSDGTGTPWEEALVNDLWGYFQKTLAEGGVGPSGNADTVVTSQYFQAARNMYGAVFQNLSDMQNTDSSELANQTIVMVQDAAEFLIGTVKTGTVTDDGIRLFVFVDDANRYVERITREFVYDWSGTMQSLGGVDQARFFTTRVAYSATAPASGDYRFPSGARLVAVGASNSGSEDISGFALWADPTPTSPAAVASLEHQLTAKVDLTAGETRFLPILDGAPDTANAMALAWSARQVDANTTITLNFFFELIDNGQASVDVDRRRGDSMGPLESFGLLDIIRRVADVEYPNVAPLQRRFNLGESRDVTMKDLRVNPVTNIQRYTESPQNATWYAMTGSGSINAADTVEIEVDGASILLSRIDDTSTLTRLLSDYNTIFGGTKPLIEEKRYIISFYVMKATELSDVCRFHMRPIVSLTTYPGHGQKMATARVRRVWGIVEGGDAFIGPDVAFVFNGDKPEFDYPGTLHAGPFVETDPHFFEANLSALIGDLSDCYVGGFTIELAEDEDDAKDGIIIIGDDFTAGTDTYPAFSAAIRTAGNADDVRSLQWSRWLEMELNARAFNRGIADDMLSDMATRWATDVTAIATNGDHAKYVVIQGGAWDIVNGFDASDSPATVLANLKSRMATLVGNAITDSLIPVVMTVTPHPGIYGSRNDTRVEFNEFLKTEYPLVVDVNQVLESSDRESIVREPDYTVDGYNLGTAGKKAVGGFMARQSFWILPEPKPYQAALGASDPVDRVIGLNGIEIHTGSGSPNGVVDAPKGSQYFRTDLTGAGDAQYAKTTALGITTGWVAV